MNNTPPPPQPPTVDPAASSVVSTFNDPSDLSFVPGASAVPVSPDHTLAGVERGRVLRDAVANMGGPARKAPEAMDVAKLDAAISNLDPSANRRGLDKLRIVEDVPDKDGYLVRQLLPELQDSVSGFIEELLVKNVIPQDVSLNDIKNIIMKYFGLSDNVPLDWLDNTAADIKASLGTTDRYEE